MKYESLLQTIREGMANSKKWNKTFKFLDGYAYNAVTGQKLIGISQLVASAEKQSKDYQNNLWLTFSQAMQLVGYEFKSGEYVYKGEGEPPKPLAGQKSTKFVYAKPPLYDVNHSLVKYDRLSDFDKQRVQKGELSPIWTYGVLSYFNIEQLQCDFDKSKVKYQKMPDMKNNLNNAEIDSWIENTGVNVAFHSDITPCYIPGLDEVNMLPIGHFETSEDYYSTFFHELGHATLHPSRLNRKHDYAEEELVAELTSAFKCADFGFSTNLQHTEYLAHWAALIENSPKAFSDAVNHALKATKFLDEQVFKSAERRKLKVLANESLSEIRANLATA